MFLRREELKFQDTDKDEKEQLDFAFNLMILAWSCGLPIIMISIFILIRAWRGNLDTVKILCALLILSQICLCVSRTTNLQAHKNKYLQNDEKA